MEGLQLGVDGPVADHDDAGLDAHAAGGSDAEKDRVDGTGVLHQFDDLVQQYRQRSHADPVRNAQHRTHFVHGVSVRGLGDVIQASARGQVDAELIDEEVGEVLHSVRGSSHADELSSVSFTLFNVITVDIG